jgi:hypothetical protein
MYTPRWLSVGDLVTINRDISNAEGTYGTGHEFRTIEIHFRGDNVFYDLRDHRQRLLGEAPVERYHPRTS